MLQKEKKELVVNVIFLPQFIELQNGLSFLELIVDIGLLAKKYSRWGKWILELAKYI